MLFYCWADSATPAGFEPANSCSVNTSTSDRCGMRPIVPTKSTKIFFVEPWPYPSTGTSRGSYFRLRGNSLFISSFAACHQLAPSP